MLSTDIEQVGEQTDNEYTLCKVRCVEFTEAAKKFQFLNVDLCCNW